MANWDLRKLQQHLERKQPGALYLLFGEESYLLDESLSLLKERALADGAKDFNYDQFFASETRGSQVRDTVEMLPMMCERRVVIYRDVHQLKEADWAALLPLFEQPVESCCFILTAEKIDKRKKHFKKMAENGVLVELKRPYDNQLPGWVDYIAYRNGLELSREALSLIQQLVGASLAEINSEMKKLRLYLGDRSRVEAQDVLSVVSQSRMDTVFDLANAIGRGDRAQALQSLANLLEQGQNEVGALALIARHMRILATLKQGMKSGLSGPKLSAKAGIPHFFLQEYTSQLPQWSDDKMAHTFKALQQTDKALKSSPVSAAIWLENFVIQSQASV